MCAQSAEAPHQPLTVLVVDDSPLERQLMKAYFRERGDAIIEAGNGAEALLTLSSHRPDIAILDGHMPILDGYQLCRLLKDAPSTRQIPVILMTGQASGLSRLWARVCGADRFLLKGRETAQVVEEAVALVRSARPPTSDAVSADFDAQELGIRSIQERLAQALEHRLLETAVRDSIGHLYAQHRDAEDMMGSVLDLLHELVLPGAILVVMRGEQELVGLGMHGAAVGDVERREVEAVTRRAVGGTEPWRMRWIPMPGFREDIDRLREPVFWGISIDVEGTPLRGRLAVWMERGVLHRHERLFEVAAHELGRILGLETTHRQLLKAQATVHQAEKMERLAHMAGAVAHDFNNLFQGIQASLEVGSRSVMDERGRASLSRAMGAVQRGSGLAKRMQDFSGHLWCAKEKVDLNALVRESTDMRASLAPSVPISLQLAEGLPTILGDHNRLRQALLDLLENAAEALTQPGGAITLTTRIRESGDLNEPGPSRWFTSRPDLPVLEVVVEDTGTGATEEVLGRMCEPFFSTRHLGRGLGLSATLGVLKAHHAALQIATRLGQGTHVHLYFPFQQPSAESDS